MRFFSAATALLAAASTAHAAFFKTLGMEIGPIDDHIESLNKRAEVEGTSGYGTFDQLIDHNTPELGTFKQRFWYGFQYWKGPGSPIILVNPGEQAADGFNKSYLSDQRLAGWMAKDMGAAVVIMEHRYWGNSSPFDELTVKNLQYLTLENSLKDINYFAEHIDLPFDKTNGSKPANAPWIFSGGSYSGALAGWLEALYPGTFWAYHGTSGVVETLGHFWTYFVPVLEATPQNCTKDLTAVIDYVDSVLLHGTPKAKRELKSKFKLQNLTDADFASAIESGPWSWQSTQFYSEKITGYNPYYRFCDYVENVWPNSTNKVPGPLGVGIKKALDGYAKWFVEESLPGTCESSGYDAFKGEDNVLCFQNQNASNPIFHDLSVDNAYNRQWNWFLCNEPFEWWQDGAPLGRPSIVSRLVDADYWRKQCPLWFPAEKGSNATYGIKQGKRAEDVNKWTGGWKHTNGTRIMQANGSLDPWRDVTLSSKFRPGGPFKGNKNHQVRVIEGGTHCSDFYGPNWSANEGIKKVAEEEVAQMGQWVADFYKKRGITRTR
ncbi:hypothetical protein GE21DRAFT_9703 [Neurospora crassa]|uniref:Serine peptidase n=1 Tax=Neurospora crassa (strain ATCC 24698 / 74-OR23-1A / CBS 708.71 / DSM 1257 / FGSC 987) TaxID=367110 RepID=Q7S134_NEUCR|nr:serine peptidase [Neurospora crassa OR74A]EAA29065.1 serine peptidase [Neurospora crassa OR74A]KHE86138.1 hypothetical protein GE21DRAFT_9703 [Neurospora crassa]|eukprot:XP_958301.1 serine peptidase [Neurospora crassa OR74A]